MQTPSGFNVPINNLMKQAKDDIVGTYQYDRSQLAPVSPPQEDSFNWLNAAGLGALAAGLGGLGYLGYRNRARLIPEGFERRPGSATGAPTTGPEPGPRRPSPAAPINVEEGRPRTVQTTDLNTPEVDYIERALGMFPQERRILEEASELGGVRRVDVSDKGVPTFVGGVVPSQAAKQSRQAKTITSIDDVLKERAAEIQAQRQYRNELSSTANALINEIRGTGGTKIVDLNPQASHAAQAMNSGAQQDARRNERLGGIQQETAKGGGEILQRNTSAAENLQNESQAAPATDPQSKAQSFVDQVVQEIADNTEFTESQPLSSDDRNFRQGIGRGSRASKLGRSKVPGSRRPGKGGVYEQLIKAGIPEVEVEARVQAYANSTEPAEIAARFLDPNFNANTVGQEKFADALGLVNVKLNKRNEIVQADFLNPEGEVRRSFSSSYKPTVETKDETFDPIAKELGTIEGMVSVTPGFRETKGKGVSASLNPEEYAELIKTTRVKQEVLGEQYKKRIDEFGEIWDQKYQESLNDPSIEIKAPRRESRYIDAFDLDLPTRIEYDETGEPLNSILYRDQLDQDIVARVEGGEQVFVENVPFLVNKARAIETANQLGDSVPELQLEAEKYIKTGKALASVYDQVVRPVEDSKLISRDLGNYTTEYDPLVKINEQLFKSGAFFEPGESEITPAFGSGSMKGRLVGGTSEIVVGQDPTYDLGYAPYKTADGREILVTKGYALGDGDTTIQKDRVTLDVLNLMRPEGVANAGKPLYLRNIFDDDNTIRTQPMMVPNLSTRKNTTEFRTNARNARRDILDLVKKGIIDETKAAEINKFINMDYDTDYRPDGRPVAKPVGYVQKINRKTGKPFNVPVWEATMEEVNAPLQVVDVNTGAENITDGIDRNQLVNVLSEADRQTTEYRGKLKGIISRVLQKIEDPEKFGLTQDLNTYDQIEAAVDEFKKSQKPRYQDVAQKAQQLLEKESGIRLPVLDSQTAYNFIQNVTGAPQSTVPSIVLLTENSKTKALLPTKENEILQARELEVTNKYGESRPMLPRVYGSNKIKDTSRSRGVMGQIPIDITQSPKSEENRTPQIRLGWDDDAVEDANNYEDVGSNIIAYYPQVELGRSRSPEQMKKDAGLTGPKKSIFTVPLTASESDPALYERIFGGLDNQESRQVSSNVPNIYANEIGGNTVSQASINEVLGLTAPKSLVDVSQATSRISPQINKNLDFISSRALRGNPLDNLVLTPSMVRNIQNPGGDFANQVQRRGQEQRQALSEFKQTANLTPGGVIPLTLQQMRLGAAPGDMTAAVTSGGRIVGSEVIASRPTGSQLLPGVVLKGPNNMTATQTLDTYGVAPGGLQNLGNRLMYQAQQNKNRELSNLVALQNYVKNKKLGINTAAAPRSTVINISPNSELAITTNRSMSARSNADTSNQQMEMILGNVNPKQTAYTDLVNKWSRLAFEQEQANDPSITITPRTQPGPALEPGATSKPISLQERNVKNANDLVEMASKGIEFDNLQNQLVRVQQLTLPGFSPSEQTLKTIAENRQKQQRGAYSVIPNAAPVIFKMQEPDATINTMAKFTETDPQDAIRILQEAALRQAAMNANRQ